MRNALMGLGAGGLLVILAGCSTAGPTHVYFAGPGVEPIGDRALAEARDAVVALVGFVAEDERVVGLAYDYNTDHLWLRVLPGDRLRVVNRPANRVEAEYDAATGEVAAETASLDLAVRSADRRVYAVAADGRTVVVFHQLGRRLADFVPEGGREGASIGGLAYDQTADRLLVLWHEAGSGPARAWVTVNHRDGRRERTVELGGPVRPTTLGYDDVARELLVPLREEHALGRFDRDGTLVGRVPLPVGEWAIDAGKRSLLRLF